MPLKKVSKERAEADQLFRIRHSAAHLMAAAVLKLYPGAKLGTGPATEDGFFYDIETTTPLTERALPKLEQEMRALIAAKHPFTCRSLPVSAARKKAAEAGQSYKVELINQLAKDGLTQVSYYATGDVFEDLCEGPHVDNASEIGAFKLLSIAGAYWHGDQSKPQMNRIYGTAFATQAELERHLLLLEEAKKRDHKKLGKQLGLFMFHETAPGMPYWLPKGLIIYNELVNFWRTEHAAQGYQEITSPLVNKAELWITSGHWEHYKDDMFIADMGEHEVYGIKPMNCPNAMVVFQSMQVSYKDLPLRLSDTDRLHRYERSGTLNGLFRVRSFQQDDSHNFISEDMIAAEYEHIFGLCEKFYSIFGLTYSFRLGTRPEKFLGDKATWDKAEQALREILQRSGKPYSVADGDGAFYGPKVDIIMKDSLGREWQMGTMQLDFQLPQRFKLCYVDRDGRKQTPVVVHRVIYGSLERFIGILIEHYAGAFPLWLAPVQLRLIPVSRTHQAVAKEAQQMLLKGGLRAELDASDETLGKKVRAAKVDKIPFFAVLGDKEVLAKTLTLESRETGKVGAMSSAALLEYLLQRIRVRTDTAHDQKVSDDSVK